MSIDTTVAHNARVWNYWLNGKDHYAVDRQVGEHVISMFPSIAEVAQADRAFLRRAVRHLAGGAGIDQFLDIGTGLPTADNTHQVAQQVNPQAKIVYVDNDPLVLTHARALLTSTREGKTDYIEADAHNPADILAAAGRTIDFERPVGVMLLGVLNFIVDTERAAATVEALVEAVPSGSYVAISHPTTELGGEANREAMAFWNENATPPITARSGEDVEAFVTDLDLEVLEPGLVSCPDWRPDIAGGKPSDIPQYAIVARKT
ncbi:SAM-dependent methyltransferase [Saccharopolyspora griseoalba]|uniref:SAM-dependent methyltransferase n=1 Tax=Saccharopolyspora griseoalba TaxID=1431848 RepID=A0ABW2LDU9_9PSEU